MKKIVVASSNPGKIKEIRTLLKGLDVELLSLEEFPEIKVAEETGSTFEENAFIKAKSVFEQTNLLTISDDSGLEVDALNGEPGVHSARYVGENATDKENCDKLLSEIRNSKSDLTPSTRGRFKCVMCLYNGVIYQKFFEGECEGNIILKMKGRNGFGYDPLFVPEGYNKTFAELDDETKNKISHRGKALKKLKEFLIKV